MQIWVCFTSMVNDNRALQLPDGIELDFSLKGELNVPIERKYSTAFVCMKKRVSRRYICTISLGRS